MKLLHILAISLVFSMPAWAQKKLSCQFSASNKKQFDSVVRPPYLVLNPQVKNSPAG
ncbi:hypothetical protein [Paraflavitalea speifideaquila]|uniref:hypothetical protein n=1 Tax=Paraflavitalea speifideaquila TaxID=3076558 RepID=UPI0028F0DD4B|nr:hypothetical protein [Paraflavitalea speifideiaquila]